MYRDSDSIVRTAVGDTTPFPITVGVHQGSVLSPFLFSVILDEVSNSIRDAHEQPPWLLMYADDIALADSDRGRLVQRVNAWKRSLENGGLKLNVAKTEYLACNTTDPTSVRIGEDTVERTDQFKPVLYGLKEGVGVKVRKGMLRWFGHVERMHDERMTKQIYNAKVDGSRSRGRPRHTFHDQIDRVLAEGDVRSLKNRRACMTRVMNVKEASEVCKNKPKWRSVVRAYPARELA
ncbi:hypothetical protein K1T71_007566 [Dendrolimus kikuchii]|uniref:Uncharacterized protein n=1 Tax=Dendrolimus kikuchii TaxID=765133 RepID=A0ACC1CXS8_9NEOP|nr:hypothetical protein K1T71_007566 [Dendrolimus kikuchii]